MMLLPYRSQPAIDLASPTSRDLKSLTPHHSGEAPLPILIVTDYTSSSPSSTSSFILAVILGVAEASKAPRCRNASASPIAHGSSHLSLAVSRGLLYPANLGEVHRRRSAVFLGSPHQHAEFPLCPLLKR